MTFSDIIDELVRDVGRLTFRSPITHVYNPLEYARASFDLYLERHGDAPKEVIFLGMNPGPWGMAQTGVPFGEVHLVREWLGVSAPVGKPAREHPKRPILGFSCPRSEVSGKRLWGWARARFEAPERFFERFFVANYCPLLFLDESGRNRTPDRLAADVRGPLLEACDRALRRSVRIWRPRVVVGVGRWAEGRAREALSGFDLTVGRITHPSPANPAANRGWESAVEGELEALGIEL